MIMSEWYNPGNTEAAHCLQAAESRDALAKTLYSNLFDWLVAAINRKIPSYGAACRLCSLCRGNSSPLADGCSDLAISHC